MFTRTPGNGHVTAGKILQVAQVGAVHAQRLLPFDAQEAPVKQLPPALGTLGVAAHHKDDDFLAGLVLVHRLVSPDAGSAPPATAGVREGGLSGALWAYL